MIDRSEIIILFPSVRTSLYRFPFENVPPIDDIGVFNLIDSLAVQLVSFSPTLTVTHRV